MRTTTTWLFAIAATFVVTTLSSCTSSETNDSGTYKVDCVAILGTLGTMPSTQSIPISAMPYSGIARDKTFAELTDDELGRFSDFDECMIANGYRTECFINSGANSKGDDGAFSLHATPFVAGAVNSCIRTSGGSNDSSIQSREEWAGILRKQYGSCHVGPWEDCDREQASGTHLAPGFGPLCVASGKDCP